MYRALDPYHRIRAAVAAIFVLTVAMLALMTVDRPVRRAAVGVSTAAPAGVVAPAGISVRHLAKPRGGSAAVSPH